MPAYSIDFEEYMTIEAEVDGKPWCHEIKAYIKDSEYLPRATSSEKKFIRGLACQFFLSGEVLYKRNHDTTLLRCIDAPKANHFMEEMHEGMLEAHASGPLLAEKIMTTGYYGLTMERDCIKHVRTCHRAKSIRIERVFLPNLYTF